MRLHLPIYRMLHSYRYRVSTSYYLLVYKNCHFTKYAGTESDETVASAVRVVLVSSLPLMKSMSVPGKMSPKMSMSGEANASFGYFFGNVCTLGGGGGGGADAVSPVAAHPQLRRGRHGTSGRRRCLSTPVVIPRVQQTLRRG